MLAKLGRRTKEARLLEAARASLTRHCGGAPNDIQRDSLMADVDPALGQQLTCH